MEQEARIEEGVSRRKFLKLSGLFGLTLGALSLPSLGWGETSHVASESAEEEQRLAHRRRKSKKAKARKRSKRSHKPASKARGKAKERTAEMGKAHA